MYYFKFETSSNYFSFNQVKRIQIKFELNFCFFISLIGYRNMRIANIVSSVILCGIKKEFNFISTTHGHVIIDNSKISNMHLFCWFLIFWFLTTAFILSHRNRLNLFQSFNFDCFLVFHFMDIYGYIFHWIASNVLFL